LVDSRATAIRSLLRALAQQTTVPDLGSLGEAIFRIRLLTWSAM
jgi:hypothetical protein